MGDYVSKMMIFRLSLLWPRAAVPHKLETLDSSLTFTTDNRRFIIAKTSLTPDSTGGETILRFSVMSNIKNKYTHHGYEVPGNVLHKHTIPETEVGLDRA